MLLGIHIIVALISVIVAMLNMVRPSRRRLIASYGLITATLLSGTLLMTTGVHILNLCISGLCYTAIMLAMTALARRRLTLTA